MMRNSFVFLYKINHKTEIKLWKQGISDWNCFLSAENIKGISKKRKFLYDKHLEKAKQELNQGNSSYFIKKFPSNEFWRLYDEFKDECCFLDIESSGVGPGSYITVVGLFDGYDTKTMIQGINFDAKVLKKELEKYKLIVTFNGATFDVPFIKKRYPDLMPNVPNFDLKVACQKIGLVGGLKLIEKKLGIKRKNNIVNNIRGGDALTLWRMYSGSGNKHYLKLLVEYNEEDCINLKYIADYVVKELTLSTGVSLSF